MIDEIEFQVPRELFSSDKDYEKYLNETRCAICHERLEFGDKWQLVIVHSKCLDRGITNG